MRIEFQDQAKEVQMDPEAEKDFMRALANQIASEDGKPDLRVRFPFYHSP